MSFFQNLLSSIMERSLLKSSYFRSKDFGILHEDINKALESVMSKSGEISSLVFAEHLSSLIEALNDEEFIEFFETLHAKYDLDAEALLRASNEYSKNKTQKNLELIFQASEPQWVKLFKRLNTVSEGTLRLVRLRERIRSLKQASPSLEFFDRSLLKLFKHWFNPSFLVLESIDWSTPANILEKIIAYEAVHEINSWDDLRARLAPDDRRCFAFFHPLMPNEPLIFVEVALSNKIPNTINEIITIDRSVTLNQDINTAVFYSISNCQEGLSGISFGNFLIKQVAHKLKQENDGLDKFVTLSPAPSFVRWLEENSINLDSDEDMLLKQALIYLTASDREDGLPNDPVAKFHLGNGAILERINLNADLSSKGLMQSKGVMVNYLYNLDTLEENHELFFKTKEVKQSDAIKSLRKKLQI
ncbi:malonyl-CoA decarboxylase [Pseudomonadota bacterium]|uniref:Decarboxylase n=1 Tax=SAR86 cluster bacterium TaxID=2030880 RepID=A0A520LR57_9GAMM|nr:malonyl-CoA decarboxylase [Pseudomonadota bacterium]MDC0244229.1 malonyl-CoA decarboxylase [Pseudomonadota bacterium]RZO11133.1 MAG: decarboxylase [SAR86 cluster bacterium]